MLLNDNHLIIFIVANDSRRGRRGHRWGRLRWRRLAHSALGPLFDYHSFSLPRGRGPARSDLDRLTDRGASVMVPRVFPTRLARHHAGCAVRRDGIAATADLEAGVDQPQQKQEAGYRA